MSGLNQGASEREAIRTASQWYVRLTGETVSEQERLAWQHWLSADPLNNQAWQRIEAVRQQMAQVPGQLAASTLRTAGQSRRQVLRGVVLLASAGSLAALGWRSDMGQRVLADYRTGIGERRTFTLADGSQLQLNTNSAVQLHFDGQQRVLQLLAGELMVSTASDPQGRPFSVTTAHGGVRALGTRFTVRTDNQHSEVAVLEKAVEVSVPGMAQPLRLEAGQRSRFTGNGIEAPHATDASTAAWQRGSLIAIDQPLGELLDELSRYRAGWLNCDPRLANLKVSGAFPIDDTDRALSALERSFPVQVQRRTRYWVTVRPRS